MIIENTRKATREELINKIEELQKENQEIRQWKYTIDTIEDLDKLKELDLIKIKGKEYISKNKIEHKIKILKEEREEYNNSIIASNLLSQIYLLESILED